MKIVRSAPEFAHYPDTWHMSPAIEANGLLLLSGQTGVHPDGSISGDPETQIRDTFRFLDMNLRAAGLGLQDIAEMTTYHVGLRTHLDLVVKVKDELIHAPYPAWTAIGVTELWTPGSIIEVRAIASARR